MSRRKSWNERCFCADKFQQFTTTTSEQWRRKKRNFYQQLWRNWFMFWKCIIQVERERFCVVGPWTWRAFLMLISLFSLRFIACNIQKRIKIGLYVDHPVLACSSGTEDRFVFRWSNKNVRCRAEHKNACIWIRTVCLTFSFILFWSTILGWVWRT